MHRARHLILAALTCYVPALLFAAKAPPEIRPLPEDPMCDMCVESISFAPSEIAAVDEWKPELAEQGRDFFEIGRRMDGTIPREQVVLLRFDVPSLGTNFVPADAVLALYQKPEPATNRPPYTQLTICAERIFAPWAWEGTAWTNLPLTEPCDDSPTVATESEGWVYVDIAKSVQKMIDEPGKYAGLLLRLTPASDGVIRLWGREGDATDPDLQIERWGRVVIENENGNQACNPGAAEMLVTPAAGPDSAWLTVQGRGFTPNDGVTLRIIQDEPWVLALRGSYNLLTDAGGAINRRLNLQRIVEEIRADHPDQEAPFNFRIELQQGDCRISGYYRVLGVPALTVDPGWGPVPNQINGAPAGYALRVTGQAFRQGGPVQITLRDPGGNAVEFPPGWVRHGANGAFTLNDMFINQDWKSRFIFPGPYTIIADDGQGGMAEARFHITNPSLYIDSADDLGNRLDPSIPRGGELVLQGRNYPPDSIVPILIENGVHQPLVTLPLSVPERPATFPLARPDWLGFVDVRGDPAAPAMSLPGALNDILQIDAGLQHVLALRMDGTVVAWGNNGNGQTSVPPDLSGVVQVAAGELFSCALLENGQVVCWGADGFGQSTPPDDLSDVVQISAGASHVLALRADGSIVGWGNDVNAIISAPPAAVDVVKVAAGNRFSMALNADGTIVVWGTDLNGVNAPPPGLNDVVDIAAGSNFGLALRSDGTVVAWGADHAGQVSQAAAIANAVKIEAGPQTGYARLADRTAIGWGDNISSQQPPAGSFSNVLDIVGGDVFSAARRTAHPIIIPQVIDSTGSFITRMQVTDTWAVNRRYIASTHPTRPEERRAFLVNDCPLEPLTLNITGIEVTQGIQDMDNSIPLIRGKSTFARVYVTSGDQREIPGVKGVLRASRNGEPLRADFEQMRLFSYENPDRTITAHPPVIARMNMDRSLNFRLPFAWIEEPGEIELTAEVWHYQCDAPVTMTSTTMRLFFHVPRTYAYTRIRVQSLGEEANVGGVVGRPLLKPAKRVSTTGQPPNTYASLRAYVRDIYPLADQDLIEYFNPDLIMPITVNAYDFLSDDLLGISEWSSLLNRLGWFRTWTSSKRIKGSLYGMVHRDTPVSRNGGMARDTSENAAGLWTDDPLPSQDARAYTRPWGGMTLAHELGHLRGFRHVEECRNDELNRVDRNYPYHPRADIGDGSAFGLYGFYVNGPYPLDPSAANDLMSYCNNIWISDYHYLGWLEPDYDLGMAHRYSHPMIARIMSAPLVAGGGDQELALRGAFLPGAATVLRWNGEDLLAVVSGNRNNELTATIPARLLESPGPAEVSVVNYFVRLGQPLSSPAIQVVVESPQPLQQTAFKRVASAKTSPVYYLSGTINTQLQEALLLPGAILQEAPAEWMDILAVEDVFRPGETSRYTIALMDAGGGLLSEVPVTLQEDSGCGILPDGVTAQGTNTFATASFSELIWWSTNTAWVELRHDNAPFQKVVVSSNAPSVQLYATFGERPDPKSASFEFFVDDADGDDVHSFVQFSTDGGQTWSIFNHIDEDTGLTALPTETIPGTLQGRIRVVATDGILTTIVESPDDFIVDDKPPVVEVYTPEEGATYPQSGSLAFSAQGFDLEDDHLDAKSIRWESDRSGYMGYGYQIDGSLLATGIHVITVTAIDSIGQTSSVQRTIEVLPSPGTGLSPNTEDPGQPGTADSNADGLPDWWASLYFGGSTNANPDAMAANGMHTVREAFVAGIDPTRTDAGLPGPWLVPPAESSAAPGPQWVIPDTLIDRIYGLYGTTNLLLPPSLWPLIASERYGTGGDLGFTITNEVPAQFIRTRIRMPE
jgi:hypothetical protein